MGAPGSGPPPSTRTLPFDPDRLIYERQERETPKAWAAFCAYRDLGGDRTLPKAVEALGKPPKYLGTINVWSYRFGWRQRIAQYERDMDTASRKAKIDEVAKAHRDMLLVATSMWKLAAKDLMRWHRKMDAQPENAPLLSARDVQALADAGVKLNRLMLGEPDVITEHRHEVVVEEQRKTLRGLLMDKDALKAMDTIAEKLDGVGNGNGNGSASDMH